MHYCVVIRENIIETKIADIHIIGLGVVKQLLLSESAQNAIECADLIIGSSRHLNLLESVSTTPIASENCCFLPPLSRLSSLLLDNKGKFIVILASGDPLYYGIGRWFTKNITADRLAFYPAVSSVQAVCHALGLALQDVDVLSLHGRPLDTIRAKLQANQTLLVLTDKNSMPLVLADECYAAGFEDSQLWVCENLACHNQRIRQFSVKQLREMTQLDVDLLHVTVIKTSGTSDIQPTTPGIADHYYQTGALAGTGMISKREVRLMVLSMMQVCYGDIIWDIGAGCGGVAVELARWNNRAVIYAIEHNKTRVTFLKKNIDHFGVSANCFPVLGRAPSALAALPKPTKVFIGGSDGELEQLLPFLWNLLPMNGMLMLTSVTEKTQQTVELFCRSKINIIVECVELAVGRGELTSDGFIFTRKRPVLVLKLLKQGAT